MRHDILPPRQLSRELRLGRSPDLQQRRWIIGLSFGGAVIGLFVGAYQTGLIRRLPDILPGQIFDAEKVDASDYAYKRLQTPDGLLMVLTYAATAALAASGGKDRSERQPILPMTAAAKAWSDLVTCLVLAREEWAENRALCSWCQVATAISAVTALLATPEAMRAMRSVYAGRGRE